MDGTAFEAIRLGIFAFLGGAGALFGMQKGYKAWKNGKGREGAGWQDEYLTVGRHERECSVKMKALHGRLDRIEKGLDVVQADVKELLRNGRARN